MSYYTKPFEVHTDAYYATMKTDIDIFIIGYV